MAVGAQLSTEYAHFALLVAMDTSVSKDFDRCVACGTPFEGAKEIRALYRIRTFHTARERITANEEERVRGATKCRPPCSSPKRMELQCVKTLFEDEQGELLELQYGAAATVWRMNLGWRRRKDKSILGFNINPVTGHWVGGADETGEGEVDLPPDVTPPQRIVPYVEDRRNVLVIRSPEVLDITTMATLQYAIKRGIEAIYQLEESELMAEPLPGRDPRLSILLYESAEGGAGVLTRLATEPGALAEVAAKALEVMHFKRPENGLWNAQTLQEDVGADGQSNCEAGCYKCLLSYYTSPTIP